MGKQAGDYDAAKVQAALKKKCKSNDVVMFSFSTCPFCDKAKATLEDLDVEFTAIELDQMGEEGLQYRAELGELTDRTSMPSIWIGGEYIGGCNDGPGLLPLLKSGELESKFDKCGAIFKAKRAVAKVF